MTRSPAAFTLLERLISLAIITLLLAILIPTLSSVRNSAKAAACAANLHALGIALHAYQSDLNDFPAACVMPDPFPERPEDGPSIVIPLAPYIPPASAAYHCPTDFNQIYLPTANASPIHAGTSYFYWQGVNRFAATQPAAARYGPFDTLMADFQGYGKFDGTSVTIAPQLHPGIWPTQGGQNILYHDGSVRFFPSRKPGSAP